MLFDQGNNAGHNDGNDSNVIHGINAGAHMSKHFGSGEGACCQTHNHAEHGTGNQNNKNIEAYDGTNQNYQIGNNLHQAVIEAALYMEFTCLAQEKEEPQGDDSGRKDNFEVFAEFVPHIAALRFDSSDSSIRNDGKIVTKHGATNYGTGANGHGKARLLTDAGSNGSQRRNRTHASAHGNGDEAADNEKSCNGHASRQNGKT